MSAQTHKLIARRYFDEVVNQGQLDLIDELFVPDHTWHDPARPEGTSGLASIREYVTDLRKHYRDAHYTVEDQVAEEERVVTRWTFHGTRKSDARFLMSTSEPVMMAGMTISRFAEGKMVESWIIYDRLVMMQQFGTIGLQAYSAI